MEVGGIESGDAEAGAGAGVAGLAIGLGLFDVVGTDAALGGSGMVVMALSGLSR